MSQRAFATLALLVAVGVAGAIVQRGGSGLGAAPAIVYTSQTTAFYAGAGGPAIGSLTPGTPVTIIAGPQAGARAHVAVVGWSAPGAETLIVAAPGQRIVLVTLAQPLRQGRTVLTQAKDAYGTVWQHVQISGWVARSALVPDLATVWTRGEQLYAARCSACHALHAPDELTANQWPGVLQSMAKRAGLTSVETDLIVKYLQTHAKQP